MNLLDAYRYLTALEQHRHFGRAAQACHITQPALSNALRALEAHLDVAIVRRGRQYEGLTPEGELVLATAHRMLREQEALRQDLHSQAAQPSGRLVIGSVPTALPIATRFAAELSSRCPQVAIEVRSLASQEIETGLDHLAIDLGLGYPQRLAARDGGGVQVWPQYLEHYYLVERRDDAGGAGLQFGAPVTWAEAARRRLCLLTPDMHNRTILDEAFAAVQAPVRALIETNSVLALMVSVRKEGVSAVLPGALLGEMAGWAGGRARALVSPEVRTPIAFLSSRQARPTRALQAALELMVDPGWRDLLAEHTGPLAGPAPGAAP